MRKVPKTKAPYKAKGSSMPMRGMKTENMSRMMKEHSVSRKRMGRKGR